MRGGMSDYDLGLVQDRWDRPMCDRCGDLADHVSPDGMCASCVIATEDERHCVRCHDVVTYLSSRNLCDGCEAGLDDIAQAASPAGVVIVLASVLALIIAGLAVAWQARPFDGAHLILAPVLVLAGAALLARFLWVQHRREGVRS